MQGSDKGHGIFSYAVGLSPYAPGFFVMLTVSARRRTGLFLMRTGLFLMLTWLFLMLLFLPAPSLPKPGFSLCSPVAPCTTIGFSLCSPLRPPSPPKVGRHRARLHEPRTTSAHTTVIRNALPQHWRTPVFFAAIDFCHVHRQRPSCITSHRLCPFRVHSIRGPAMMTSVDGPVLMTSMV